MKILFVCLGNICRSPMAEFLLKNRLEKEKIYNVEVSSKATSNYELGNEVHHGTKKILSKLNIDIKNKVSEKLEKKHLHEYDLIIGMDANNIRDILKILGTENRKIESINDIKLNEVNIFRFLDITDEKRDIKDPWYTGNFDETYNDIEKGIDELIKFLRKN